MGATAASFVEALSAEEICPLCLDHYFSADECTCVVCHGPSCPRCAEAIGRSEEHTSELQSRRDLVCRLLLEKKKEINLVVRGVMLKDAPTSLLLQCMLTVHGGAHSVERQAVHTAQSTMREREYGAHVVADAG